MEGMSKVLPRAESEGDTAMKAPVPSKEKLCPNCGKDEVGTYTADDSFLYGISNPVRLIAKNVEFFRCMACEQVYTGEDGEKKRQLAVQDHLSKRPEPKDAMQLATVVQPLDESRQVLQITFLRPMSVEEMNKLHRQINEGLTGSAPEPPVKSAQQVQDEFEARVAARVAALRASQPPPVDWPARIQARIDHWDDELAKPDVSFDQCVALIQELGDLLRSAPTKCGDA